jgi:XTP/dITP diphosphohydrolase
MKLVFATANENKVREISKLVEDRVQLSGLKDIGCTEDVPETSDTIEGNAIQKAQYVFDKYGVDCFAEDTGLEVFSLDMRPGVYTARYAGEAKDPDANMAKILEELQTKDGREARFKTVIAYIKDGELYTFEGIVNGNIANEKMGNGGFGYDPVFIPEEEFRTFAQMTDDEKNKISHRARALFKFLNFLKL